MGTRRGGGRSLAVTDRAAEEPGPSRPGGQNPPPGEGSCLRNRQKKARAAARTRGVSWARPRPEVPIARPPPLGPCLCLGLGLGSRSLAAQRPCSPLGRVAAILVRSPCPWAHLTPPPAAQTRVPGPSRRAPGRPWPGETPPVHGTV
jgi:hypothetical protein